MNRYIRREGIILMCVPRACGDEPVTVELDGYPASVFPAPAGMNRYGQILTIGG